ncbi:MAG: GC-type dockerin domain-anchored protein [Phycisphaerales bacterium JB060]
MPIPFARWLAVAACAILSSAVRAPGQACDPQWAEGVFGLPGVNREIFDMITWDHGVGQSLYICGNFEIVGSVEASNIARWDGQAWSPLGSGTSLRTFAMCVFDDGTGEKLYAGGNFYRAGGVEVNNIARWTGTAWERVGAGFFGSVDSLAVFDDGDGPVLFAGGALNRSGSGAPGSLLGVAQWDGSRWNPVGSGLGRPSNDVFDMEVFDDGTGPALYAVGEFVATGDGRTVNHIARWDGFSWQALEGPDGIGLDGPAGSLAVYDDGTGPALYVGGGFGTAGGIPARHIARWDGSNWSGVGEGCALVPNRLVVHNPGTGPVLVAGGHVSGASGPVDSMCAWDGVQWKSLDAQTDSGVRAMAVYDDGAGEKLFVGGRFPTAADRYSAALTVWDGVDWAPLDSPGLHAGLDDDALAAATFDDGTGPKLFVGGQFEHAGGERVNYAARWDGARWTALDGGLDGSVLSLAVFDDGAGPALYAGGWFRNAGGRPARGVARWDGRAWSPVGAGDPPGLDGAVRALAVYDDGRGPALYAGGDFQTADGRSVKHVARWDGTSWTAVGGGAPEPVRSLHVFDAGKGPVLYAGGDVQQLPGWRFNGLRRWDGRDWRALPWLVSGTVDAMATYDDGRGSAMYLVGGFDVSGVPGTRNIARWDGTRFEPLRSGLANIGFSATTFDAGDGPRLVVGGQFSRAYGGAGDYLAQWDGRDWAPLEPADASVSGIVSVLHAHDDGSGPALFAGGRFTSAGGHASSRIARYGCVLPRCEADLDGDGELTVMDFLAFQMLFDAGDARADFDGDGALRLFDFLAYQNAFAAGCP